MLKKSFIFALLFAAYAPSANAFLEYCQDIRLPEGYRFVDEKFPLCNFEENLSVVAQNGRYGFADDVGSIVIPAQFEEAYNFQDGLALIKHGGKYGYIFANGMLAIAPVFEDAWGFNDGVAKVSVKGKVGFINKQGKLITPMFDDSKDWFESGVVAVFNKAVNQWGMIDKAGRLIVPYSYERIDEPSNGRVLVAKKMAVDKDELRFGYLGLAGEVVIAPSFSAGSPFKNGVAEVITADGQIQFINTQGKVVDKKVNFEY